MDFSKISAGIFGAIFIVVLYFIIYYALKIMYKDIKGGGRRRRPTNSRGSFGLEILKPGESSDLKEGSVIPIRNDLTIGRKEENSISLSDQHVSGNHARVFVRNTGLFIEDLNSTNGTYVNGNKIRGKQKLSNKDEIRIGTSTFKVLS
ncbi:FHA domain-containing protein [Clostridium botulinum]|uniref:FHA domain-containing protein n=1 Tax=Clostridium botulinum TaxID=1491 RepID=A0A0C2N4Y3_CLOBO|nr:MULTISPECIES: FHA domain-containing protein [Clostridium]ACD52084.1 FHA-domain containing secreted protein [Clostridium botulinum E3 str. Alaska E43]AJF30898.1 signal peptide protein [Clostridium botulinum]AJF33960.1 signal peptide protein [Clostridium botulinum]EES50089.1 FHA-domain containing secreted protein [Clostridium botulinum E1 str. 'BoNT E Beluga']KAI3348156.1 FHA domain-containing protein [Clostridium botulinum]